MKLATLCLLALSVAATAADAQSLYRWVDKNGKVTYSDQPPPSEIKKVDKPRLNNSSIETSGLSYEAQQASRDFPVTLFTSPDCAADCDNARALLRKRGIPFSESSIVTPENAAAFRKRFASDKVFVPSMTVGSQKQQGFEEEAWNGLLDSAGYPRTAIPGSSAAPRTPAAQ